MDWLLMACWIMGAWLGPWLSWSCAMLGLDMDLYVGRGLPASLLYPPPALQVLSSVSLLTGTLFSLAPPLPAMLCLLQKVDAELAKALATLEAEKATAMKGLDQQVDKLSSDILGRVLPEGVRV